MKAIKFIHLDQYEDLLKEFLKHPTWTKQKHQAHTSFKEYLEQHIAVTIRVHPSSKYNYCDRTHSFTTLRVPPTARGKLYKYRDQYVLIRCSSFFQNGWTQYLNEVYLLQEPPSYYRTEELKATYGSLYIQQQLNREEL